MRTFSLVLALVVAIVLPLQAQQLSVPLPAEQPAASAAEVQMTPIDIGVPAAPELAPQVEAHAAVEASTVREPSARNLFTIIGVVVVAAALFAMFR